MKAFLRWPLRKPFPLSVALAVACPICDARPDATCRSEGGDDMGEMVHSARWLAATS